MSVLGEIPMSVLGGGGDVRQNLAGVCVPQIEAELEMGFGFHCVQPE
jgi:hypothetical protein